MFLRKIYQQYSTVIRLVFGARTKLFFEWLYWKFTKIKNRKLDNQHYQYFFTEYFDLSTGFYAGKHILDIGCGPRGSLEWASSAQERIGLDPLADRYLRMGADKHQMRYVNAPAEEAPFAHHRFDVISSFNALDHVDDLGKTISEIKRLCKPGGIFLLITDIHEKPAICEPSVFSWDIIQQFSPEFTVAFEKHFEGNNMYKSIRAAVPFDHDNPKTRYGILTAMLIKN